MARTIAVLGASNTGKSTLVDRMCALEGQPHPAGQRRASSGSRPSPISARPGRPSTPPARSSSCTSPPTRSSPPTPPSSASAPTRPPRCSPPPTCTPPRPPAPPPSSSSTASTRRPPASRDIVAALQDYAGHPIVLRQIPIREGGQITGAVDLVSERAWAYREGEPSQLIEIPAGTLDREHEARGDAARASLRVRRPPARGADRGPGAAERRGLFHLRPRPPREPRHRGADRLRRPRQRHRPRHEGAPPRGPGARRPPRAPAGAGRPRRAAARR